MLYDRRQTKKLTITFTVSHDEDIINKALRDKKIFKIEGHLWLLEKDHKKVKLYSNKQSVEDNLIERAAKLTTQTLYDKGVFDNYNNGGSKKILEIIHLLKVRKDVDQI